MPKNFGHADCRDLARMLIGVEINLPRRDLSGDDEIAVEKNLAMIAGTNAHRSPTLPHRLLLGAGKARDARRVITDREPNVNRFPFPILLPVDDDDGMKGIGLLR